MDKYKQLENESTLEYILRLVGYKLEYGEDLDWEEITEFANLDINPDSLRKAMQPKEFGAYAVFKLLRDKVTDSDSTAKLRVIQKELQKVRDENLAIREHTRNSSRKENILEQIREYTADVKPLKIPTIKQVDYNGVKMIGGIADAHFGKELKIEGLRGEILNEYNEQIFYDRMWKLLDHYVDIIQEEGVAEMTFCGLGDDLEGLLRISALQAVKYGYIEGAVKYAKFMAEWLNQLSAYVVVDDYPTLGNHSETRILNSKSGDFAKENMEYIITELIRAYLKDSKRINIYDNQALQYIEDRKSTRLNSSHVVFHEKSRMPSSA
jgi:hypothetical protein